MLILGIETSDRVLSLAVMADDELIGLYTSTIKRTHGERLAPELDHLLKSNQIELSDLDRIAVSVGPGSYTGLRIGVTMAKVLAQSLDIELVAVSSLSALAFNVGPRDSYIVPLVDARRQNVYTGLYKYDSAGLTAQKPDQHRPLEEWLKELQAMEGDFLFVKDYGPFKEEIEATLGDRATFAPLSMNLNDGQSVVRCGLALDPVPVDQLTPAYLKLAEAEENWRADHEETTDINYVEKI